MLIFIPYSCNFHAGVPLELLEKDFWVPGLTVRADSAKFAGKQQWREILNPTGASVLLWVCRLVKEHVFIHVLLLLLQNTIYVIVLVFMLGRTLNGM